MQFVRQTYAWVLAVPLLCLVLGFASNQAVLWANGDRFPVVVNPAIALRIVSQKDRRAVAVVLATGMLDNVHCVMTPATRLNFLADWIDLKTAWVSPGDLLLWGYEWMWRYAPTVWLALVLARLKELYDARGGGDQVPGEGEPARSPGSEGKGA